jgi:hypothetical protein
MQPKSSFHLRPFFRASQWGEGEVPCSSISLLGADAGRLSTYAAAPHGGAEPAGKRRRNGAQQHGTTVDDSRRTPPTLVPSEYSACCTVFPARILLLRCASRVHIESNALVSTIPAVACRCLITSFMSEASTKVNCIGTSSPLRSQLRPRSSSLCSSSVTINILSLIFQLLPSRTVRKHVCQGDLDA